MLRHALRAGERGGSGLYVRRWHPFGLDGLAWYLRKPWPGCGTTRNYSSADPRSAYDGVPFISIAPSHRGLIFEKIAKEYDDLHSVHTVVDPKVNTHWRSSRKGWAPYDWLRCCEDRSWRVEAKSSKLTWNSRHRHWTARFSAIKTASHDCLILIIYAPWGLELWRYKADERPRLTSQGKSTGVTGMQLQIYGQSGELCAYASWIKALRPTLEQVADHIVMLDWSSPFVRQHMHARTRASVWYDGVPFSILAPSRRARAFEDIARRYERNGGLYTVAPPSPGKDRNGIALGKHMQAHDWLRCDGARVHRVEAKHAAFSWNTSTSNWRLAFSNVKFHEFDKLLLIVYAPWGLELWEYHVFKAIGVSTRGKITEILGKNVIFYGPRHQTDLRLAWDTHILQRLHVAADHVATIEWDDQLVAQAFDDLNAG